MAQGTALVMISPNVLVAFWRYHQRHPLPFSRLGVMGLAALLATWPAARLAVRLDSRVLTLGFVIFLAGLAAWFLWGVGWAHRLPERSLRRAFALMLLLTSGLLLSQGALR